MPHGEANYQFLTEVFKTYFRKDPNGSIKELNEILVRNLHIDKALSDANPRIVYHKLDDLLGQLTPKNPLHHYGMKPEEIDGFTENVLQTQQRLLANNYVQLDAEEIINIYKSLY